MRCGNRKLPLDGPDLAPLAVLGVFVPASCGAEFPVATGLANKRFGRRLAAAYREQRMRSLAAQAERGDAAVTAHMTPVPEDRPQRAMYARRGTEVASAAPVSGPGPDRIWRTVRHRSARSIHGCSIRPAWRRIDGIARGGVNVAVDQEPMLGSGHSGGDPCGCISSWLIRRRWPASPASRGSQVACRS